MRNTLMTLITLTTLTLHSMPSLDMVQDNVKPYVENFFTFLDDNGIEYNQSQRIVIIMRKSTSTGAAGIAYQKDDDSGVLIMIHDAQWEVMNETSKMWLVYHELGHDLLNLSHSRDLKIMNEQMKPDFSSRFFNKAKEQLIKNIK